MSFHFADIARHAAADRHISADEILELRRAGWADGRIKRGKAEAIFATQHTIADPSAEWSDFFVEAIRQFVLEGSEPRGFADEEEAQWLIAQIRKDGRVCSMTELELLTSIIEKAHNVPESLKAFVLEVIEDAVMMGTGATRCGGTLSDTHVTEAEARFMRRVIFGSASDRPAAVSRREAEMLFRIKDAVEGADNAPEFKRLFVQGVGNYLMGFAHQNAQLSAERQMELEAFVEDNEARVGAFLSAMARQAPNAFGVVFGKKAGPDYAQRAALEAEVTSEGRHWLDGKIAANGITDAYDRALLEFIAEETGQA